MAFSSVIFVCVFLPAVCILNWAIPGGARQEHSAGGGKFAVLRLWGPRAPAAVAGVCAVQLRCGPAGGPVLALEPACVVGGCGGQPRGLGLLQVSGLSGGESQPAAGRVPAGPGGGSAPRHLLFHLSGAVLRHRRLPDKSLATRSFFDLLCTSACSQGWWPGPF